MNTETTQRELIIAGLQKLFMPIVRFCLRRAIKLHDVMEVVKISYVRAAEAELRENEKEASASKLSVMTGVHRKDVTRIIRESEPFNPSQHIISKVMTQWQHHPHFRTKSGPPRVLSSEGRESEFAKLIQSVNGGNVSPYAVLYEMERIGAIKRTNGTVRLVWQDYAPPPTMKDGLDLLASDTNDLVRAVEENIFERQETPLLHLKTAMDNITPSAVPELRKWILEQGSLFHKKIREKLSQFDCDLNPRLKDSKGGARISLGTFSFIEKRKDKNG